jgi:hypothetical protein
VIDIIYVEKPRDNKILSPKYPEVWVSGLLESDIQIIPLAEVDEDKVYVSYKTYSEIQKKHEQYLEEIQRDEKSR